MADAAVGRLGEGVEGEFMRRRPRVRRRIVVQRQLNELDPLPLRLLRLGVTAGGSGGLLLLLLLLLILLLPLLLFHTYSVYAWSLEVSERTN